MSSSDVTLRPDGAVRSYRGRVVALEGNNLEARLARPGAHPILLRVALQIDASGAVVGTADAQELLEMTGPRAVSRLLRGVRDGETPTLSPASGHPRPVPDTRHRTGADILDDVERSGLRGRGGAHVSAALKLRAVASRRRRAVVVANGAESEPASRKDSVLLANAPHLVIDGAVVAAAAVGADEAILYVKRSDARA